MNFSAGQDGQDPPQIQNSFAQAEKPINLFQAIFEDDSSDEEEEEDKNNNEEKDLPSQFKLDAPEPNSLGQAKFDHPQKDDDNNLGQSLAVPSVEREKNLKEKDSLGSMGGNRIEFLQRSGQINRSPDPGRIRSGTHTQKSRRFLPSQEDDIGLDDGNTGRLNGGVENFEFRPRNLRVQNEMLPSAEEIEEAKKVLRKAMKKEKHKDKDKSKSKYL